MKRQCVCVRSPTTHQPYPSPYPYPIEGPFRSCQGPSQLTWAKGNLNGKGNGTRITPITRTSN